MLTICTFLGACGYHIFGLPISYLDPQEKLYIYGTRAVIVIILVFVLWIIGISSLFLYSSILLLSYSIGWLHLNKFDPALIQSTNKIIEKEILRLETERQNTEVKFLEYKSEKSNYETLSKRLTQSSTQLEERQAEIIKKEKYLNLNIEQLNQKIDKAVEHERLKIEGKYSRLYKDKTEAFIAEMKLNVDDRLVQQKNSILNNVFSFDETSQDDSFELKQLQDKLLRKEEDLNKKSFLAEVDQKIAEASSHSLAAKHTLLGMKSENLEIRGEIKDLSNDLNTKINEEIHDRKQGGMSLQHALEKESWQRESAIKGVEYQIGELKHFLVNQIKEVEMNAAKGLQEVSQTIGQLKLDMGKEVLRLDGQQQTIISEMELYYAKNERFIQKAQQLHIDAQQQKLDGQQILQQVNSLHSQHKMESKGIEQRLEKSIDQLALKEGQLANTLGESMLKLKQVSDQQYIAMKDMCLEKKDINLLHREKNIEHKMNLQEVKHAKENLDQAKHEFSNRKQSTLENAKLTHQLFMKEQQYSQALIKERNSKGFLSRLASHIENSKR